jgi:transcription initiation factor TFIID TATA-box-binding protein
MFLNCKLKIVNLVVTFDINLKINLSKLMATSDIVQYTPDRFPAAIVKIKEPRVSFLVFSTGKIVCIGAKKFEQINDAFDKLRKILAKIGVKVKDKPKMKVSNMVVTDSINKKFDLAKLAMKLDNVEFEPEQFPALIHKVQEPRVSFLIFSNGRIICAGSKSIEIARKAMKKLINKLEKVND